jgi:uncharacterized protein
VYVAGTIIIGFLSAVVAGMFGIGGAAVSTPAIRVILGVPPNLALGTPLPVTIPTAVSGAIAYHRKGLVDTRLTVLCGSGGLAGATAGALLTKFINLHYLMLATGAVVLYLAGNTIYRGLTHRYTPASEAIEAEVAEEEIAAAPGGKILQVADYHAVTALLVGIAGGFGSGLLGIGGGIVFTPCFLYLFRMPIKKSFGTSLSVIALTAVPGAVIHTFLGHVSWSLVLCLVIGTIPGAYTGARLSIKAREPLLYFLFGTLLCVFGVVFIVNEILAMV